MEASSCRPPPLWCPAERPRTSTGFAGEGSLQNLQIAPDDGHSVNGDRRDPVPIEVKVGEGLTPHSSQPPFRNLGAATCFPGSTP